MEQGNTINSRADVRCERLEAIIRSLVQELGTMKDRLNRIEARVTNTERANT